MSSDGPEYDEARCPGCGKLFACTCPTLAEEYAPVYEAIKAARTANKLQALLEDEWGTAWGEAEWAAYHRMLDLILDPEQTQRHRG